MRITKTRRLAICYVAAAVVGLLVGYFTLDLLETWAAPLGVFFMLVTWLVLSLLLENIARRQRHRNADEVFVADMARKIPPRHGAKPPPDGASRNS